MFWEMRVMQKTELNAYANYGVYPARAGTG